MDQGANRIVVGLPLRYEKAKRSIAALEETIAEIRNIVAVRGITSDTGAVDAIERLLEVSDE